MIEEKTKFYTTTSARQTETKQEPVAHSEAQHNQQAKQRSIATQQLSPEVIDKILASLKVNHNLTDIADHSVIF